jgi:hypothetical protein
MLQLQGDIVLPRGNFPVCRRQKTRAESDEEKDERKHHVGPQREQEKGEERERPHDEIECDSSIISDARGTFRCASCCRVGVCDLPFWELEDAEGEPKYGEHSADHHWEEVTHDPFENSGEDKEKGSGEDEDSTAIRVIVEVLYTTLVKVVAPPHPIKTIEKVAVAIAKLIVSDLISVGNKPHETHWGRICKSLTKVSCNGILWLDVQLRCQRDPRSAGDHLLEQFRRDSNNTRGPNPLHLKFMIKVRVVTGLEIGDRFRRRSGHDIRLEQRVVGKCGFPRIIYSSTPNPMGQPTIMQLVDDQSLRELDIKLWRRVSRGYSPACLAPLAWFVQSRVFPANDLREAFVPTNCVGRSIVFASVDGMTDD